MSVALTALLVTVMSLGPVFDLSLVTTTLTVLTKKAKLANMVMQTGIVKIQV